MFYPKYKNTCRQYESLQNSRETVVEHCKSVTFLLGSLHTILSWPLSLICITGRYFYGGLKEPVYKIKYFENVVM
jgi:hypothetical protein